MVQFYQPKYEKSKKQLAKQKLTIERLDGLGQGIAFLNKKPIFIQNALPDEVIEAQLTEDKKQFAKAKVLKWLCKSPDRIEPKCEHYLVCGGCQLQHLTLEKQHEIKRQHFDVQFKQSCKLDLSTQKIDWISEYPFAYRRRVRIALYQEKDKKDKTAQNKKPLLQFGLRQANDNKIVNITNCPVLTSKLQAILMPIKQVLMTFEKPEKLGHLDLLDVESGVCAILRIIAPLTQSEQEQLKQLAKTLHIQFYLHGKQLELLEGQADLAYQVADLTLAFSPFDFIQINAKVNQQMITTVLNWIDFKDLTVLDLFCGMGNFSLPMAKRAKKVVGIEGVTNLIEMAQQNAIKNHALLSAKTDFYQADLTKLTGAEKWLNEAYDVALLDPARDGAALVSHHLISKKIKQILYISCNLATLARDMALFLQNGYKIEKIKLVDMFPQTKHNESMLLLRLIE